MRDSRVMVLPVPVGICTTTGLELYCCPDTNFQSFDGYAGSQTKATEESHLQKAMSLGVKGMLELSHVLILLGVDVLIRKVHRQSLYLKLHAILPTSTSLIMVDMSDIVASSSDCKFSLP